MKLFAPLLLLISVFLLAGCAATTAPPLSLQELTAIDYGPPPADYEKAIKDYFAKTLFQPESAQYRFGAPYRAYVQAGPLLGGKVQDAGYLVEVWLKAKDRSGATLPEKHLGVLLKNNEVLLELIENELAQVKRPH